MSKFSTLTLIFFFRAKLQDLIQNSSEPPDQVFQSLFGKENPDRVRCCRITATPTML